VTEIPRIEPTVGQAADRDQETARLLMRGDHEGLRRLLVDHAGKVLALLRKEFLRVLDFQEIEDAGVQSSARAWRSGSRFDPSRGSLGGWFFAIARNCARRVLETKGKHATLSLVEDLDSTANAVMARSDDAAPDKAMATDSFLADVRRCIEALAPQQRAVLMADDVATSLGTSKNSIYVSRNNGRRNLRAAMAKLGHTFDGTSAAALREWQ